MKIQRLAGAYGLGFIYDGFSCSAVLALLITIKFSWTRAGACRFCQHGPMRHKAKRTGGMIVWSCVECPCRHYDPVVASKRVSKAGLIAAFKTGVFVFSLSLLLGVLGVLALVELLR